jgi:WS/DGAT/MGAT family acyltransferase
MPSTAMSPLDAAWYHMDGPGNLAMVTGVLLTKRRLDFEKVRAVYRDRLSGYERFHQRVVERGFLLETPYWEDVPHFDMDQHLHHVSLPAPHGAAALRALITDLASAPLDHQQPLWQVHVVDQVEGGSALIMRFHHCLGDGTAMMAVMQKLFDASASASAVESDTPKGSRRVKHTANQGVLVSALETVKAVRSAAGDALEVLAHPQALVDQAVLAVAGAGMLVAELLKWPDPASPLKGDFGLRKHVAWSNPVAIRDVKAVGASYGAKVNDVLVAAMTGALRSYLRGRGVDVQHTTVRAMVPVDLRPAERLGELGNEFGLVILDLAVTQPRWPQRLAATRDRMALLKRSTEPVAMRLLLDIFGRGPKGLEDVANMIFGSKASVVMSNVAGPRTALYLAGVPIDRMMYWVPHPGKQLGMGISIMSYRGMASLTVIADARLIPDPEAITRQFDREFKTMLRAVKRKPAAAP